MSIEIIPTGAALGAEIRGVDLARSIDDEPEPGGLAAALLRQVRM